MSYPKYSKHDWTSRILNRLVELEGQTRNGVLLEYDNSLQFAGGANDMPMHQLFWEDLTGGAELEIGNDLNWLQPSQEPSANQSFMIDSTLPSASEKEISAYVPSEALEELAQEDSQGFQDIIPSSGDAFYATGQAEIGESAVEPRDMYYQVINEPVLHGPEISAMTHPRDLSTEGICKGSTTQSTIAQRKPSHSMTSQQHEELNTREYQLSDVTNKVAITQSLVKIYHESLENSLVLWVTEDNCPYNLKMTISGMPSTSTSTQNLYNCATRLDAAFSGFRTNHLTRGEDSGSSKALKLATMAFASQWSYSAEAPIYHPRISPKSPGTMRKKSCSYEFEHLLRQSLWNEAQRSIHRWQSCGSFRMILAQILFSLVHRPLDVDDITEMAERYKNQVTPVSQDQGQLLYWDTESFSLTHSAGSVMRRGTYILQSIAFDSEHQTEGTQCLENALRQLQTWRKIVSSHTQPRNIRAWNAMSAEPNSNPYLSKQDYVDFNGFFWMGLMCDTTSSVLNKRSFVIEDNETSIAAGPTHPNTQTTSIWGSYLMDVNLRRLRILESTSTSSASLPYQKLHEAIPIKVLMWRRVGCLRQFLEQVATPQEIEKAIREALDVYQYWMIHYHPVFEACVKEHSALSYQLQSWYVVFGMHWHLGCLLMADFVEQLDKSNRSESLGRALRTSSALVNELKKTSAYAIADIAQVSCSSTSMAASNSTDLNDVHVAISRSVILSDPHTDKMLETLEAACKVFLEWLHGWQSSVTDDTAWLHAMTTVSEIERRYENCVEALELLQTKSDVVDVIMYRLSLQRKYIVLEGDRHASSRRRT
ncbi:hypothetical protein H2200_002872 [Cladophialophora chaetospira]|uniref:Uncharacterized protein n=1 Tax=Cladophialophora chaetospira TaxID=386627 RepID=A0AA38XGZ9_9EURO|nr:hypothetical protein H2200_002872 [Cladophialophora chaetospira]